MARNKNGSKPKRNKKYAPKKDQTTVKQIDQMFRAGGTEALVEHFKRYKNVEYFHLSMTWDLFDVSRVLDMYQLMNDDEISHKNPAPLNVLQSVYKGDLIIALRENLIDGKQCFKIRIDCKARLVDDHSKVVNIPYEVSFEEPIDYDIFMRGTDAGRYYVKDKHGFKTPWKGITPEWNAYLGDLYEDEYEVFAANAKLECTTQFLSWAEERQFKQLKLLGAVRRC